MKRIRQRKRLTIQRDDHIGDLLGAIFLDLTACDEDAILQRLGEYLGRRVRIIKAELTTERAEVEVEVQALDEEAGRLAAAASDLHAKGARRNALAMFREALELDPLNRTAAMGLGLLLADLEHFDEALKTLKRAREAGPEDVELLLALGRVCVRVERTASAIAYLERAFAVDPGNFAVRRALAELGRKPRTPPRLLKEPVASAPAASVKKQQ